MFSRSPRLITWEGTPERRDDNGGAGMCNLGSGERITCVLGGIRCNVDHVRIVWERWKESSGVLAS